MAVRQPGVAPSGRPARAELASRSPGPGLLSLGRGPRHFGERATACYVWVNGLLRLG